VAFLFVLLVFLSLILTGLCGGCLTGVPEYRQPPHSPSASEFLLFTLEAKASTKT
jgi:hypothetical protein